MAITSTGIGSGLNVASLVSQLMTVEAQPLNDLTTKEASFQAKISAFGTLQGALSTLQTAAKALADPAKFSISKASSSDSSTVSATATSTAPVGNHKIEVKTLADYQRVSSNATTAPTVAPGSLTITFGTYKTDAGVTSFAPSTSTPATITLDSGSTMEELRDAINKANAGVTASVVNNGSIKQLVIAGNSTGANQAFTISGSGGLAGFSYDRSTGATSSLDSIRQASDASLTLDGVSVTRSSNTGLTDLIDGVTVNLNKANVGTEISVNVAKDNSSARTAIDTFVKAYNDLNTTLVSLTAYDTDTKVGGTLLGDATARSVQSQVRAMLSSSMSGTAGVNYLSDLGITFKKDGSLATDSTKLDAALKDPTKDVAGFFAGTTASPGLADKLVTRLNSYLDSNGVLAARTNGLKASISSIDKQRDVLSDRLTQIQARYTKQFNNLDSLISSMNQTSSYLTQQLASLSKVSG